MKKVLIQYSLKSTRSQDVMQRTLKGPTVIWSEVANEGVLCALWKGRSHYACWRANHNIVSGDGMEFRYISLRARRKQSQNPITLALTHCLDLPFLSPLNYWVPFILLQFYQGWWLLHPVAKNPGNNIPVRWLAQLPVALLGWPKPYTTRKSSNFQP